jgi:hypothetical protein
MQRFRLVIDETDEGEIMEMLGPQIELVLAIQILGELYDEAEVVVETGPDDELELVEFQLGEQDIILYFLLQNL